MDSASPDGDPFLHDLARRRGELRESLGRLELALSAPAPADQARWRSRVYAALGELAADVRRHVEITEGPEGLYHEILAAAPRLSDAVTRLTSEHAVIGQRLEDLMARVDPSAATGDVTVVRDLGTELLGSLVRHRQHGADLVYEAYEFDIGGDT